MAVIGTAEVEIKAKVDAFEKSLRNQLGTGSKAFSDLGASAGKTEGILKRFGFTTRDLSVVLGAGLAGGAAFAAREVLRFANAAVEASSALEEQRSATQAVFEANSEIVRSFAESASAIGFSERAALQATNTFGGFFQNIGLSSEAAANLGVGFVALAADISSLMDIPVEDVQTRLISGLRGEQDAVERLNVSINEKAVADRAMTDSGKKSVEQLTQGERVLARAKIIYEQTAVAQGDLERTSDSLANTQRRVNAEFENAKAGLGEGLKPIVTSLTQGFSDMLFFINEGVERLKGLGDEAEKPTSRLDALGQRLRDIFTQSPFTSAKDLLEDFGVIDVDEDAATTADETAKALEELADAENQAAVAAQRAAEETDKLTDAQKNLTRAIADAERAEDKAERNLARAREDAILERQDAERAIAEAIEDRAERIADAEQRVADVRLQGNRSVRAARERLADFERDSEKRQIDNTRRIIELEKQRTRAILGSLLDLRAAQDAGDAEAENRARLALRDARDDSTLAQARKDIRRDDADRQIELDRLERDLHEARMDRRRELNEAIEDAARVDEETNERIADADRRLADVRRQNARSIEDAERGLEDAIREGTEAVEDQILKLHRLNIAVKRTRQQVQGLAEDFNLLRDAGNANLPGVVGPNGEVPFFAAGGQARRGHPAIVGERGPELIFPQSNATVVSNEQVVAALKGLGGSAGPSIVVTAHNVDERVLANELRYRLAEGVR